MSVLIAPAPFRQPGLARVGALSSRASIASRTRPLRSSALRRQNEAPTRHSAIRAPARHRARRPGREQKTPSKQVQVIASVHDLVPAHGHARARPGRTRRLPQDALQSSAQLMASARAKEGSSPKEQRPAGLGGHPLRQVAVEFRRLPPCNQAIASSDVPSAPKIGLAGRSVCSTSWLPSVTPFCGLLAAANR